MKKETIKLAFYKNYKRDILDYSIAVFQFLFLAGKHSKYTHTEINIRGLSYTSSYVDGGVRKKKINYSEENWEVLEFEVSAESVDKMLSFFENEEGKKYDLLNIFFAQFLHIPIERKDRWICSEICAKMLDLTDEFKMKHRPVYYSPAKLHKEIMKKKINYYI